MHLLQLERLVREREEVAVARRIDDGIARDRLAACLRGEDDVGDAVAVADEIGRPAMIQQTHACLGHPVVRDELELLRIVGDRVAHFVRRGAPDQPPTPVAFDQLIVGITPFCRRRVETGVTRFQPLHQLLAESCDDLPPRAVVHRQQQHDQPAGGEAAQVAVALDEDHVRALAAGGDGS